MSASKVKEIQQQIAYWIFEHAPRNWSKCCIYMELLLIDEDMDNSWTTVWFDSNNKEMIDIEISALNKSNMKELFVDLNNVIAEIDERWTTCKMKVTSDGKYNFDFGYDRPPRLKWDTADDLLYHPDYASF